ncbi:hypothetical protein Tco_1337570, partial [Tanacetum coccineum]
SMEAEFPSIVVNDDFEPTDTLQCKTQVSISVNDEIDFRISFDESDDEDYIIICDKNSFSYKMISVNNLKMDLENNYEKVMHLIPSPELAISCFDDLDFFKGFENEFSAIVYNDAQTSKPDLLTEPILNTQHIDEFDLSDETSLSEYNEEEQNVLYFNDLFPLNIIRPDDLKSEKDKDDNDIDITQSLLDNEITHGSTMLFETSHDKDPEITDPYAVLTKSIRRIDLLIPIRRIHSFDMPYEGLEYTDSDIADFESRLERILSQSCGFSGYARAFEGWGPLVWELILEFLSTLRFGEVLLDLDALGRRWSPSVLLRYWSESERMIPGKGDLHDYWRDISTDGDFLGPPPSYTLIRDSILRLCHRMMAHSIAGRSHAPEKSEAHISGGQFMGRLAQHFGLLTAEILGGLTAWVAMGPERQPDAMDGAPAIAEDAPAIDEGDQAIPAPMQAPQQPPPPPVAARTMPQRLGRLEEEVQGLCRDVGSLRGLVEKSTTDQGRFTMWMMSELAIHISEQFEGIEKLCKVCSGSSAMDQITPTKDGNTKEPKDTLEVDVALIATGRAPFTQGFGKFMSISKHNVVLFHLMNACALLIQRDNLYVTIWRPAGYDAIGFMLYFNQATCLFFIIDQRNQMEMGWCYLALHYCVFFTVDIIKFAIGYVLSGKAWNTVIDNMAAYAIKKDYGRRDREAQWAHAHKPYTDFKHQIHQTSSMRRAAT